MSKFLSRMTTFLMPFCLLIDPLSAAISQRPCMRIRPALCQLNREISPFSEQAITPRLIDWFRPAGNILAARQQKQEAQILHTSSSKRGRWFILFAVPILTGVSRGSVIAIAIPVMAIISTIVVGSILKLRRKRAERRERLRTFLRSSAGRETFMELLSGSEKKGGANDTPLITSQEVRDNQKDRPAKKLTEDNVVATIGARLNRIDEVFGANPALHSGIEELREILSGLEPRAILFLFRDVGWTQSFLNTILRFGALSSTSLRERGLLPHLEQTVATLVRRVRILLSSPPISGTNIRVVDGSAEQNVAAEPDDVALISTLLNAIKTVSPGDWETVVHHTTLFRLFRSDEDYGFTRSRLLPGIVSVDLSNQKALIMMTLIEEADHLRFDGLYEEKELQSDTAYEFPTRLHAYGSDHTPYSYLMEMHAVMVVRRFGLKMLAQHLDAPERLLWIQELANDDDRAASLAYSLRRADPSKILTPKGLQLFNELEAQRSALSESYRELMTEHPIEDETEPGPPRKTSPLIEMSG
jgi:hypothetical protein